MSMDAASAPPNASPAVLCALKLLSCADEESVRGVLQEYGMPSGIEVPFVIKMDLWSVQDLHNHLQHILHKMNADTPQKKSETEESFAAALFALGVGGTAITERIVAKMLAGSGMNVTLHEVSPSIMRVMSRLGPAAQSLTDSIRKSLPANSCPIFENARTLGGAQFHSTAGDFERLKGRYVGTPKMVDTFVVTRIRGMMQAANADGKATMVVGGGSGTGKTQGVIGVSSELENRIVVYALAKTEALNDAKLMPEGVAGDAAKNSKAKKVVANVTLSDAQRKAARNESMLQFLVDAVSGAVNDLCVRKAMDATEKPLKVLVAVDEMGTFGQAVRAMCALTGGTLKAAVAKAWGMALSNVAFFIAAIGTGVGWAPGYDREAFVTSVGSETGAFEYISTEGDHRGDTAVTALNHAKKSNWKVFASHFSINEACIEKVRKTCHPIVDRMVSGNARFAACLAKAVKGSIDLGFPFDSYEDMLVAVDLFTFIGPAAMHFKNLNSLDKMKVAQLWAALVKSVRLYMYPFSADGKEAHAFEVKHGLIQNLTLVKGRTSPIHMPDFTGLLLPILMGRPLITAVDGGPFEEYVLATLYLLACGAGGSGAFTSALTNNGGAMGPLLKSDVVTAEASGRAAKSAASQTRRLCSFLHDMARDVVGAKDIADAFAKKFDGFAFSRGAESNVFVVAFRCYDEATPFADVFFIVDNALYLLQCKEAADSTSLDLHLERWKMGSLDGKAAAAKPADSAADVNIARNLIKNIITTYFVKTGVKIDQVRSYVVRPRKATSFDVVAMKKLEDEKFEVKAALKDDGAREPEEHSWGVVYHKLAFIDTSGVGFMSFHPERERFVRPLLFTSVPSISIEKVVTPFEMAPAAAVAAEMARAAAAAETCPSAPPSAHPPAKLQLSGKKTRRDVGFITE